jgi:hypothetical protein
MNWCKFIDQSDDKTGTKLKKFYQKCRNVGEIAKM